MTIGTIKIYHNIYNHCTSTLQKKLQNALDQFREQFCINEAIAKIENNSLEIILI